MNPKAFWQADSEKDFRRLTIGVAVSFGCHLVLFVGLIAAAGFTPTRRLAPSAIRVTMVSLPGPAGPPATAKAPPAPSIPKPVPEPPKPAVNLSREKPKPKPKVSLKEKTQQPKKPVEIKKKESLKKKTFKPSRVVKRAISRLEKKVESKPPDPLTQALARLENSVGKQQAAGRGAAAGGQGDAGGKRVLEIIDIYRVEVAYAVQANWAFSEQLAGGRPNLEAKLAFRVLPSGAITDIRFDQRSGNGYLDESARKAIVKSNPVPPHPQGVKRSFVTVGLRFTPEGVQ